MADDRTRRTPQDASKISLSEDYEVRYWTETLGISKEKLAEAVGAVGNGAEAVREYLR